MASTMAIGLNYIAKTQIKQLLDDLKTDDSDIVSTSIPLIYTSNIVDPKLASPYLAVNPLRPNLLSYGHYNSLDKDKSIHKTVSKYIFYKIVDKWLYDDLKDLLAFVKIVDGKPQLIRNMADFKPETISNESVENIEKRIAYIEHILLNKKLVRHVLKKIVKQHNIHWYHLNKHSDLIKKTFYKYIKGKLSEAINNYNRQQ
jgi:hypothetical protein